MRKLLLTLFCVLALSISAYAASSDSVTVKVTITPALSVDIAEANLAFGAVNIASTTLSSSAVTVTNNGSGINQAYSLSLTNPAGWAASQTTAGPETYILNAAFDSDGAGITWAEASHALSTTPAVCTATKFSGDQAGVNVPYNAVRKLWFQFKAPTATAVTTEQNIILTVTAQAS